jgi:hypothetical protein
MKVRIDAGGREVEIECSDTNMDPVRLADKALAVWQATQCVDRPGPAVGYSAERSSGREVTSSMRRAMDVVE